MSLSFPSWFFSTNASNRPFLIPTDSLNKTTSNWLFLFAPDLLVCDINASYLLFLLNPYSFKINHTDILFLFYSDSFPRNDSDWLFLTHFRNASLFSLSFPFWLSEQNCFRLTFLISPSPKVIDIQLLLLPDSKTNKTGIVWHEGKHYYNHNSN